MKERLGKGGGEIVGLEATDRTRVKIQGLQSLQDIQGIQDI